MAERSACRVFVNSLPKSGTNLIQRLLETIGFRYSRRSVAVSSILGKREHFKRILRNPGFDRAPTLVGLEADATVSSRWLDRYVTAVPAQHYFTGHAAHSEYLDYILHRENMRVLQIIRDPRDVVLSWVEFAVEEQNDWAPFHEHFKSLNKHDRIRSLVQGGYDPQAHMYMNSLRGLLKAQERWYESDIVLAVRFEDLVGSQGGGNDSIQAERILQIARFVGIENINAEEVGHALFGGTHTFRYGQVGRWRSELDKDLLKLIEASMEGIVYLIRLGYRPDA